MSEPSNPPDSPAKRYIDIVFDSHESGRFVEVENADGQSICFGEWMERKDGYWVLRIPDPVALLTRCERAESVLMQERECGHDWTIHELMSDKEVLSARLVKAESAARELRKVMSLIQDGWRLLCTVASAPPIIASIQAETAWLDKEGS